MPHVPDTVPGKRVTGAGARTEGREASRQTSEVGAVCGQAARTVLCGGRPVMGVPTAIAEIRFGPGLLDRHRVPWPIASAATPGHHPARFPSLGPRRRRSSDLPTRESEYPLPGARSIASAGGQPRAAACPSDPSVLAEDRDERVAPSVVDLAVGQFQLTAKAHRIGAFRPSGGVQVHQTVAAPR